MATPLVSIIVPVYNVEAYLRECLDSVIAQTYTSWECICVNDGSPDNSQAILDEYAQRDTRFRVIVQENRGLSGARNSGMRVMRGDYVFFLDSDDILLPDGIEGLLQIAREKQADVVEGSHALFSDNGEKTWDAWREDWAVLPDRSYHGASPTLNEIRPFAWSKLISKQLIIDKNLSFVESLLYAEDFPFTSRLAFHANSYATSSLRVVNYRQNRTGSLMASSNHLRLLRFELDALSIIHKDWQTEKRHDHIVDDLLELYFTCLRNRAHHLSWLQLGAMTGRILMAQVRVVYASKRRYSGMSYVKHLKRIVLFVSRHIRNRIKASSPVPSKETIN